MISVRIIKKPKNTTTTASSLYTSSSSVSTPSAKEASHAATADEASHAATADEASHAATADEASHAATADEATYADNADKWDGKHFADFLSQPVRPSDNVAFADITTGSIHSATFVGGWDGNGFALLVDSQGRVNLTLDNLTVRQSISAFQLLIEKVRSVGGQIVVSPANGIIKEVSSLDDAFYLSFEDDCEFLKGDLMRCQVFNGSTPRSYWVEVKDVINGNAVINKSEFPEGVSPMSGDEVVLMGNTSDSSRQNLISIAATSDGQPRIDILSGVHQKSFDNALRARLGCLDGIEDAYFPASNQPHGSGLYADNVYLRGSFCLSTGEDVLSRIEAVEGKISSSVEAVRADLSHEQGFLNNAGFTSGLSYWLTKNEASCFLLGDKWIWANANVLSKQGAHASVVYEDGRTVLQIHNCFICQTQGNYNAVPESSTNTDGLKEPAVVCLSFFYKVTEAGHLSISFQDLDTDGFVDFSPLSYEADLSPSNDYQQLSVSGLWNGTGNFRLAFTGSMSLRTLLLSTNQTETLAFSYRSLFEQSARLVNLSTAIYDKDKNLLQATGLITSDQMAALYAINADGSLQSLVGASNSGVLIKASNIAFEGLVTANENFSILSDGSIVAKNGSFSGKIVTEEGSIGGFAIANGRIGATASADSGTGLSITDEFLRVGNSYAYAMLGSNVAPSLAGGTYTAAARIVNHQPNAMADDGLSQTNYGLILNVAEGSKNVGILSNAPLQAPACINTRACILSFDTDAGYSMDFSLYNVFLLSFVKDDASGISVNLPTESSVADKFGLSSLPSDFALVITFRVRPGSLPITITGIYNHNESLADYKLYEGDSIQVLLSVIDGFRYQILNHQD